MSAAADPTPGQVGLNQINHFIVIYQENWSFDALYGNFPGANGLANASSTSLTQIDRQTGQPLSTETTFNRAYTSGPSTLQNPPPALTSSNQVDTRFVTNPNDPTSPTKVNTLLPYDLSPILPPNSKTGDIVHRFWQEQSQIDGGKQDQYLTWSDNPGLVMSYFNANNLPEGLLAQQYTLDDNFFHAAFGGSFLNAQFLVAAQAPVYPNAPASMQATLTANNQLALDANGKIIHDGNITPINGTYNQNYAINTIYSKNLAPDFVGNNTALSLLPSLNDSNPNDPSRPYELNIGDLLDNAGVSWKWYAGGWTNALAGSPSNPANGGKTPANDPVDPNFQWHHQALAYFDNFAPWVNGQPNPLSAAHLQDETNFFTDLASGNLPSVVFIKPIGANNEHPGYTDLLTGQQHVASIVQAVQSNPALWDHTAIIITYDENGGRWDHVAPPNANGIWGDGTRVPGIIISPYAQKGYVDHTQYDTLSILKTIEQRFGLPALTQFDRNATSLANSFTAFPGLSLSAAPGTNTDFRGTGAVVFQIGSDGGLYRHDSTGWTKLSTTQHFFWVSAGTDALGDPDAWAVDDTGALWKWDTQFGLFEADSAGNGASVSAGASNWAIVLAPNGAIYSYNGLGHGQGARYLMAGPGFAKSIHAVTETTTGQLVTFAVGRADLGLYRFDNSGMKKVSTTGQQLQSVNAGLDAAGAADAWAVGANRALFKFDNQYGLFQADGPGNASQVKASQGNWAIVLAPDESVFSYNGLGSGQGMRFRITGPGAALAISSSNDSVGGLAVFIIDTNGNIEQLNSDGTTTPLTGLTAF
ncbi:MAG: acid phosphatase [Planctomycetes bacterium]|nr:acid phosphatase [Planctomycetota bacterium]